MMINQMTVVVTGAAGGIGHAISLGFLGDGAKVIAVDVNPSGLESLAGRGAMVKQVDVTDPAQVEDMVRAALDETGRLDVLFNNAGLGFLKPLTDHEPDEFERLYRVNVFGPYYGLKAAIPVMRQQNFGRIINILSRIAETDQAGFSAYGSSKASLFALTRYAAAETQNDNILVNGMIPGLTKTGMSSVGQDPAGAYPTARMLATLPDGGPTGRVFWDEKEYFLFSPSNEGALRADKTALLGGVKQV